MSENRQLTRLNTPPKNSIKKQVAKQSGDEAAVLALIAAMPQPDRDMGERLHALITAGATALSPKIWYGMPAYAKNGKVICFFRESHRRPATGRASSVGAMRYATFGFYETANLDEGTMWPVAFALTQLTPAVEAAIKKLIKKAVS